MLLWILGAAALAAGVLAAGGSGVAVADQDIPVGRFYAVAAIALVLAGAIAWRLA